MLGVSSRRMFLSVQVSTVALEERKIVGANCGTFVQRERVYGRLTWQTVSFRNIRTETIGVSRNLYAAGLSRSRLSKRRDYRHRSESGTKAMGKYITYKMAISLRNSTAYVHGVQANHCIL